MTSETPLVSIIMPTRNESKAISYALRSIKEQTYARIEVIVVDSFSTDSTQTIAAESGARVISFPGKPLSARYHGLREAKGEYILLLDADQVLEEDSVERAIHEIEGHDRLILEERSFQAETWLQRVLALERTLDHQQPGADDPLQGHLRPRFFARDFLEKTYSTIRQLIPDDICVKIHARDDEILYFAAAQLSTKVKLLPKAVCHIEERTLVDAARHSYGFGKAAKILKTIKFPNNPLQTRAPISSNLRKVLKAGSVQLLFVSFVKAFMYRVGFFLG